MFPRPTRVSSHGAILTAVAAAIACLVTAHAAACPYSIRDSAFIGRGSSTPFQLVVLTRTDAPGRAQLAKSVEVATAAWLADSNVVARLVDVDGPRAKDLPDAVRARFATPDTTPAAVLISPSDRALDLDGLGPSASSERVVLESFGHAVDSPVRRDLPQRLISSWCVVLFVAGTDDARNASARAAIDAAAKSIVGKSTELGKVIASARPKPARSARCCGASGSTLRRATTRASDRRERSSSLVAARRADPFWRAKRSLSPR